MILYSFAKSKGYDVSEKASLSSFADMSSVSTYAQAVSYTHRDVYKRQVGDRAFQNGELEEGTAYIDDVSVRGNTVTLSLDQGPADNKPFGMLCTASWAIAEEFDENGDPEGYEVYAGRSGKPFNYFTRQELDLILACLLYPSLLRQPPVGLRPPGVGVVGRHGLPMAGGLG